MSALLQIALPINADCSIKKPKQPYREYSLTHRIYLHLYFRLPEHIDSKCTGNVWKENKGRKTNRIRSSYLTQPNTWTFYRSQFTIFHAEVFAALNVPSELGYKFKNSLHHNNRIEFKTTADSYLNFKLLSYFAQLLKIDILNAVNN